MTTIKHISILSLLILFINTTSITHRQVSPKETKTSVPKTGNYIKLVISSDSSFYKSIYTLTDTSFSLNLLSSKGKDNYFLKIKLDNKVLIKTIGSFDLKSKSIQNSYYYNLQALEVNYLSSVRKVNTNDFSVYPFNLIKSRINENLPEKLKVYRIH